MENLFDLLNRFGVWINHIISISAKRAWTRLLFIAIICSTPLVIYYFSSLYLLQQAEEETNAAKEYMELTTEVNILQSVSSELKLCATYKSDNKKLAEWYCDEALQSYKNVSDGWPPERRNNLIALDAYEGMIIDVNYYSSVAKSNLSRIKQIKKESLIHLKWIASGWAISMTIFFIFFLASISYYKFHLIDTREQSNGAS
ncbi:hypothetical protein ACK3YS_05630 [Aeromonas caviae]